MAPSARQLARSAFIFWIITTLTCTSQIALIAITIGLATNNASISASIHRTAWVTAAANMVALTASLGAVCLYVRRTQRMTYIALCTLIVLLSVSATLLTMYTLTWIWNYVRNVNHPNSRYLFTKNLSKAGFGVWTVSLIAQATLFTLVFWPKQQQIAPPTPQELTQRHSPGRSVKRRHSDLTSLTPPSTPPGVLPKSEPSSPKFSSPTKASFQYSVNQVIGPMTSKTKLLLRQQSFSRDSNSHPSTRETSLEALRQEDGFESWDTSRVEEADDGHTLLKSVRLRLESRLETIPGSRPVSPANPLNGPFPEHIEDDVRLPESPIHSPLHSPSSDASSFIFPPPPTRPDSSAGQSHIHPLFRSESPGPAPVASPGTVITASPYAGQVVSPDLHAIVTPRKLHSSHSFRADSPTSFGPNRSRQGSMRSIYTTQQQPSQWERSATPGSIRLVRSPEPDESSV